MDLGIEQAARIVGEVAQFLESQRTMPGGIVTAVARMEFHAAGENFSPGTVQARLEYQVIRPDVLDRVRAAAVALKKLAPR